MADVAILIGWTIVLLGGADAAGISALGPGHWFCRCRSQHLGSDALQKMFLKEGMMPHQTALRPVPPPSKKAEAWWRLGKKPAEVSYPTFCLIVVALFLLAATACSLL